jgi:hypothetical protein
MYKRLAWGKSVDTIKPGGEVKVSSVWWFMPRISQFYGIAIYMYYRDHAPPHFHAIYGEFEAEVEIATASVLEGKLPRKARSLVLEWAESHREELERNWALARAGEPLEQIPPLE